MDIDLLLEESDYLGEKKFCKFLQLFDVFELQRRGQVKRTETQAEKGKNKKNQES